MSPEEVKAELHLRLVETRKRLEKLGVFDQAEQAQFDAEIEEAKAVIGKRIDEGSDP